MRTTNTQLLSRLVVVLAALIGLMLLVSTLEKDIARGADMERALGGNEGIAFRVLWAACGALVAALCHWLLRALRKPKPDTPSSATS